jgi:hypothetical protein
MVPIEDTLDNHFSWPTDQLPLRHNDGRIWVRETQTRPEAQNPASLLSMRNILDLLAVIGMSRTASRMSVPI